MTKDSGGFRKNLTCISTKGLKLYKNIIGGDDSLEYAKLILYYDKSVFNFVCQRSIDENELAAVLISRNNDGRIPIADNFLRSKLGIKELPKKAS